MLSIDDQHEVPHHFGFSKNLFLDPWDDPHRQQTPPHAPPTAAGAYPVIAVADVATERSRLTRCSVSSLTCMFCVCVYQVQLSYSRWSDAFSLPLTVVLGTVPLRRQTLNSYLTAVLSHSAQTPTDMDVEPSQHQSPSTPV